MPGSMARYDYRCPLGHVTILIQPMADDTPASVQCDGMVSGIELCAATAERVWEPPAAIHFHGPGFYATDVKGSQERRRRPNAGDKLERVHDPDAAAIARSL
jgi:predicted nucleic acid-binding Zn ribbon protein